MVVTIVFYFFILIMWVFELCREQLNRMACLGGYYGVLEAFVERHGMGLKTGNSLVHGESHVMPYHGAVAQGVLELLDVYRDAVLHVETCMGRSSVSSLLDLYRAFMEFFEMMPILVNIIRNIEGNENITGMEIIEMFESKAQSGIPTIQGFASRIHWHCLHVFSMQLYSWLVHGTLVDPSNDFFIHFEAKNIGQNPIGQSSRVFGRVAASQYIELARQAQSAEIVFSRVPRSMRKSLADDILVVGQLTLILQSCLQSPEKQYRNEFSETLWTLFHDEGLEWLKLSALVQQQRSTLSHLLWEELYSKRQLESKLDDFIGCMLHQRGDLYTDFLRGPSRELFRKPPDSQHASRHIKHAFHESLFNISENVGQMKNRFEITWFDTSENALRTLPSWHPAFTTGLYVPSYDAWDGICMQYHLEWPLHLLFPIKTLQLYGALWQLVFRVHRATQSLKDSWMLLSRNVKIMKSEKDIVLLYHSMEHFFTCYVSYLQFEVLERGGKELKSALSASSTFIDADRRHEDAVKQMIENSCLDIPQVMRSIEKMLLLTQDLCQLVEKLPLSGEQHRQDVKAIARDFSSKFNVIFQVLQADKLQVDRRRDAIRHWLYSMNFNGFAEKNAMKQMQEHFLHTT